MYLEIYYHAPIGFNIKFEDQLIYITKNSNYQKINYIPEIKEYNLRFCCDDIAVTNNPVVIETIVFDNFWRISGEEIARGRNVYTEEYKKYAVDNSISIDYSVVNNHQLFFTGELIYTFSHPIYKYVEKTLY